MIRERLILISTFCSLLVLFLFVLTNRGAASEILSWEDCVHEAQKNNPDLVAAREEIKRAEASRSVTRSPLLPQVSSDLTIETADTTARGQTDTYSYGIRGEQLLFDGFKTSYSVRAADEILRSTRYNYDIISSNVRFRLRSAYIELLSAQELFDITEDIVARRRQNAELVKLRYEAGREHKGSLLTAEANLAQAEFDLSQAKRNFHLAQRRLTKELGREQSGPVMIEGDLTVKHFDIKQTDLNKVTETNPVLLETAARREAARFELKSAKVDFFPELSVRAGAGRTDSEWPPEQDEWSVGLVLSFPLYEGGSRIAEVSRATAELNRAIAEEKSERDGVMLALEETWTDLQDAIERVVVRQKFYEATRERARIARAQYANGLILFDNWTIIEDDLVREQKAYLEARAAALNAEAQWVQAKGGTLEHDEK
jgi:outer membrane protein TolC